MKLAERVLGCLAGLALGDALGAPTEFLSRAQIRSTYGRVEGLVASPAWHPHHVLTPGQVTDDTGQLLAVAHAVGPDGRLTAEAVARQLVAWADGMGGMLEAVLGPSTRQALARLRQGESPRQSGAGGRTNGASYRAIVPGLVEHDHPEALLGAVVEVCLPTHGTSVAIAGAAAVAYAVARAVQDGATLTDILAEACRGAREGSVQGTWTWGTPLEGRIELALRLVGEAADPEAALDALAKYVGTDLLVPESVAAAFGVIALAEGDPMRAVRYGANLGGDTDTVAALAGAVCGAWQGAGALEAALVSEVERASRLDLRAEAERLTRIITDNK